MDFGIRVLIIKGSRSGQQAHVVYEFFRHEEGLCQMEEINAPGWRPVYLAVPVFDHCGSPQVVELEEEQFVRMKK